MSDPDYYAGFYVLNSKHIHDLAKDVGARVGGDLEDEVRLAAKAYMDSILDTSIRNAKASKSKTITVEHVRRALESTNLCNIPVRR